MRSRVRTPPPTPRVHGDRVLFARVLQLARPWWGRLVLLALLSLLATPLTLLLPVPLQIVVDSVLGGAPVSGWLRALLPDGVDGDRAALLLAMAVAVVLVTLLVRLQGLCEWMLSTWIGERLVLEVRGRLFAHLQRLSLRFHDARASADSIYRVQYDAAAVKHVLQSALPLGSAAVRIVVMLVMIAAVDTTMAAVALVVCPALLLLTRFFRGRLRRQWTAAKAVESRAMAAVQESLGAVRVVQVFGQERRERERWFGHADHGLRLQLRAIFAEGAFGVLLGITTAGGTAAVLWIGAREVMAGALTLGELLLVMAWLAQLYEPLRDVGTKVADLQKSLASVERALAVLDEVPEVQEAPNARPLRKARGEVELRDVTFGYAADRPVLRGVSFRIAAGSRVGIAGRTGSGKSSLVSLLPRLYDPQQGAVLLDGVDVREYRLADLRAQFAFVLQEPVLFQTSIAENIAYGRPGASMADIEAAARAAAAHEFIAALPDGYATEVGERGARLSGGERQRISLARAFLKDAPVLILDEPTSSVDVGTEAVILDALQRLMQGRTTFVIAHRLATLQDCDRRLFVDGGTLREVDAGADLASLVGDRRAP
jgi:ATP-binding cassette subfamily B protein